MIKDAVIILLISVIFGLGINVVSPRSIPYIGKYRSLSSSGGPIVPPDAEEGDPSFIAIDVAQLEFDGSDVLFVDARDPSDFECGTIQGSVNLPFEYLPEEGVEAYIDSILGGVTKDHRLILYCSGEECDLSLHLGRNLQILGYTNVAVFFGGSREWEKLGLEIERRVNCDE